MSIIDSQWAEASEEQKIVPDGWRLVRLAPEADLLTAGDRVVVAAYLERIPKPKHYVLMAEAEVPQDFRIEGGGAIVAYRSGMGISLDIHRFNAEVFRIEERDA